MPVCKLQTAGTQGKLTIDDNVLVHLEAYLLLLPRQSCQAPFAGGMLTKRWGVPDAEAFHTIELPGHTCRYAVMLCALPTHRAP
jgi:hypothetical protein